MMRVMCQRLVFGQRVTRVDPGSGGGGGGGARLTIEGRGAPLQAKVLVGADGVASSIRKALFPGGESAAQGLREGGRRDEAARYDASWCDDGL
jgi:2-polyprenyl-6-methoxyphenol hydroxylase-like FAD-dependent oxidoreductase